MVSPTQDWPPQNSYSVFLDSTVLIELTNQDKSLHGQCKRKFQDVILKRKPEILVPDFTVFEVLRGAGTSDHYDGILKYIEASDFLTPSVDREVLELASILCCTYKWKHKKPKDRQFADMIIGATAAIYEITTRRCSYVLSFDGDFEEPYFERKSLYLLSNPALDKAEARYMKLYRPMHFRLMDDWKTHREKSKGTTSPKK